ncbi:hypothetical protein XM38_024220 [Halomicronema hongdechloris C2206]|uniref:Uncharacterized protein n=1 Tax=Halomicronema hongdechloris C2206 TaxID=1641165 RepID=A0A1Z3HMD8_9CYAN|nr:hypothetical protein [Halomicronema hongdechloris]ASC71470.1 hypothetical protein XM38_024220 [Halomicronema hongdechloris C2206]
MVIAHLILIALGLAVIWLGVKIAEEVYQIALISTGAIAFAWGFAIAPEELQMTVEALSVGGIMGWRWRNRR